MTWFVGSSHNNVYASGRTALLESRNERPRLPALHPDFSLKPPQPVLKLPVNED